ncbi:hypothetical protein AB4125_20535 [Vibrio splendidus]
MQSNEIRLIIESFVSNEGPLSGLKHFFMENKVQAVCFIAGAVSLIIAFSASLVENSTVTTVSALSFFAFLVIYSLSTFISTLRFFFGVTKETLINISQRYCNDYSLAKGISKYQDESIDRVIRLFEGRIRFLESRVGFLVGIVDKLGIVPAVIMIYLSYINTTNDTEMANLSPIIIGIISGVYLGAISARAIIDSLKDKIDILDMAKEISKNSKAFKLT